MAKEYGFFNGETYTRFPNATSVKSAVKIAMKLTLRKENKKFTKEDLQKCYIELAECMIENMQNDGVSESRSTIIGMDEMGRYFTQDGWIVVGERGTRTSIDNSEHYKIVMEVCNEFGLEEKEMDIYTEAQWEELQHEKHN